MELETCRFVTHSAAMAGETLRFPQYAQALVGLLYLHRGEIELKSGDRPPTPMREKEASLLHLGQEQQTNVRKDAAWTLCAIQCGQPEELLRRWAAGPGPVRDCRKLPNADRLLPQLDSLSFCLEQSHALKLPIYLLRSLLNQDASAKPDIPLYLQAVRQIIDTRFQENLALESLAVQVGKSKFHLSRAFQEHYHVTPGEYLTHVRLSRAAGLLAGTDLPVQEIGRSVGISNSAYFTSLFKRQYGRPPREYRMWSRSIGKK